MHPRADARGRRPLLTSSGGTARKHKPDYVLVLISVLLLVVGLVVVYSISPALSIQRNVGENYFVTKQLTAIGLGLIAFLFVAFTPFERWRTLQRVLLALAVVATLIALVTPITAEYPARRWIRFGGLSLQSVEIVKMALIVSLAAFLEERIRKGEVGDFKLTLKPMLIVLGIVGLVVAILQKDYGSSVVIVAMMGAMSWVAGLPLKRLVQIGAVVGVVGALLILPFQYRLQRVTNFLNPESDCQNTGYQACQALIAIGSGGLFGIGLGNSGQAFGYLPEAANDSIFAIVAEKFGFFGATIMIFLFAAFFSRIKNIMERAPDDFSRFMVAGVLAWLSTQAFINVGAMLGLMPLKGITLPFISYGGTSIIFVMAAVGLVFNISRYTSYAVRRESITERKSSEGSLDWRRNRRAHNTDSGRSARA